MYQSRESINRTILSAQAGTGVGTPMFVSDFQQVFLDVSTQTSANLTFKVQGSLQDEDHVPTFSSAASATNRWFYVESADLTTQAAVAGATGYTFSGTDGVKGIKVNATGLNWLNVEVTARSAGSLNVNGIGFSNQ